MSSFFFFNDTATTEIYTLSLHDALPICFDPSVYRQPPVGPRCVRLFPTVGGSSPEHCARRSGAALGSRPGPRNWPAGLPVPPPDDFLFGRIVAPPGIRFRDSHELGLRPSGAGLGVGHVSAGAPVFRRRGWLV